MAQTLGPPGASFFKWKIVYKPIYFFNHPDAGQLYQYKKLKKMLKHGAFFIFTCKCKVLVPSLSVAKTRELSNAAYALLLPA